MNVVVSWELVLQESVFEGFGTFPGSELLEVPFFTAIIPSVIRACGICRC